MSIYMVRRGEGRRSFERQLRAAQKNLPRLDAGRHVGRLRLSEEPRAYQQRMRDQWRERSR